MSRSYISDLNKMEFGGNCPLEKTSDRALRLERWWSLSNCVWILKPKSLIFEKRCNWVSNTRWYLLWSVKGIYLIKYYLDFETQDLLKKAAMNCLRHDHWTQDMSSVKQSIAIRNLKKDIWNIFRVHQTKLDYSNGHRTIQVF